MTDGFGWKSTLRPLEETFNHIDYTMNLKMLTSNLFRDLIAQNL
ncbi:MAG: DpnII family type II restriction endonuclease [Cyanobacteria bacterium J06639_18]